MKGIIQTTSTHKKHVREPIIRRAQHHASSNRKSWVRLKVFSVLTAISLSLIISPPVYSTAAPALSLITNTDNIQNQTIKRRTLRAMYSMRTQSWPNGEHLTVFVFPDEEALHENFCQRILGILPYQLRKSWDRLIFSGKAAGPIRVNSLEEMKERVSNTPGAIGYITHALVDETIAIVEVE